MDDLSRIRELAAHKKESEARMRSRSKEAEKNPIGGRRSIGALQVPAKSPGRATAGPKQDSKRKPPEADHSS